MAASSSSATLHIHFLFAKGCPACVRFKSGAYKTVLENLRAAGHTVGVHEAESTGAGFPDAKPDFIRGMASFYPMIFITTNDVYNNASKYTTAQIMATIRVVNAAVVESGGRFSIRSDSSQSYNWTRPDTYNKIISDYLASSQYKNAISLTSAGSRPGPGPTVDARPAAASSSRISSGAAVSSAKAYPTCAPGGPIFEPYNGGRYW